MMVELSEVVTVDEEAGTGTPTTGKETGVIQDNGMSSIL